MSETKCDTCGRALPPERAEDRVFCSARCYGVYVQRRVIGGDSDGE